MAEAMWTAVLTACHFRVRAAIPQSSAKSPFHGSDVPPECVPGWHTVPRYHPGTAAILHVFKTLR